MEEGVCSLCQKNWPEENDLTLLCSNPDCKPLECHLFCLDSDLRSVPEDRDWFCPGCHPFGNLIDLLKYFEWRKTITATRSLNEGFFRYAHDGDTVGMTLRLHIPFPTQGTHIGRIVDIRLRQGGTEHFVQFRSAVNGRNLPFSCWMRLVEHDCSISEDIIHLCLPPENGVGEGRWTLGVIHYLSGRGLIDENNPNLPSITPNLLAKTFIEFNKDQYQLNLPPGSEIQGRRYPEDPHPDLHPVIQAMAQCELFERALIRWRFHSKQSFIKENAQNATKTNSMRIVQQPVIGPIPEGLSPSSNTITKADLVFHPPDYPNTEDYNSWLSLKRYLSSGALLDGGTLQEMIRYLERLKQQQQPPPRPPSSSSSRAQAKETSEQQRQMKHSLLCSSPCSSIIQLPSPHPVTSSPSALAPLVIHPAVVSEINRSFFQSKKRKWETERDSLLIHLENREVVCLDLNRISYQNTNPLILTKESYGGKKDNLEDDRIHSRIVCSNRDGIVEDSPNFPMVQWNDWSFKRDLKVAYEQIKLKNPELRFPSIPRPCDNASNVKSEDRVHEAESDDEEVKFIREIPSALGSGISRPIILSDDMEELDSKRRVAVDLTCEK